MIAFAVCARSHQANYAGRQGDGEGAEVVDRQQTTPVASFRPNAWGLFDLHGNVFEHCRDWYEGYPTVKRTRLPEYNEDKFPAIRGGAWYAIRENCRSARRFFAAPGRREAYIGCRVCFGLG